MALVRLEGRCKRVMAEEETAAPRRAPAVQLMALSTLKTSTLPVEATLGSCRQIWEFERLNRLGEGTFGVVYRARDTLNGRAVAVKRVKMEQERGGELRRVEPTLVSGLLSSRG